ncbi:MAG: adenosylcobinamide-phosphate synthase CbiB [Bacteroidales bacterium]
MTLLLGWILDRIFGDPQLLPHPIVWFGKLISACEKKFNKKPADNKKDARRIYGGITAIGLILLVFTLSYFIIHYTYALNIWLGTALSIILIFFCLAGKTLTDEVRMVFQATDRSTEQGRIRVARIVGRDTRELSPQEIRAAALETLAENLSDGVIAPIFWFTILGVPGMLAYKMINTMDSMIGYKNERYLQFGYVAAKLDDLANYIPARLTAIGMILVAFGGEKIKKLRFVLKYGNQHASPNSGYPEAALASILNCRFGGTHTYFGEAVYKPHIGENDKEFTTEDMEIAIQINFYTEVVAVIVGTFLLICGNL